MARVWHSLALFVCILIGPHFCCIEQSLPSILSSKCKCINDTVLHCKGLNTTEPFRTPKPSPNDIVRVENPFELLTQLTIEDSDIFCIHSDDLIGFTSLQVLQVTHSHLRSFMCPGSQLSQAAKNGWTYLNLAHNQIAQLQSRHFAGLSQLTELNLTHNAIQMIPTDLFATMASLKTLDLSSNQLDENVKPGVLKSLPSDLSYLDISNNTWACSSKLAWMHKWKALLKNPQMLKNVDEIRCIHEINHTSRLFLVMKYYDEIVLPHCPLEDGCSCLIHSIQDTIITTRKRHYTVHVNCAGRALWHFPALPQHTQAVDLSDNKINDTAFDSLDVKRDHYDEVENLTLDGNNLKQLPEKLLEMNLGMRFSAKNNKITSISYDVSQRLIKNTDVLELSSNPWKCTCTSQINDLNLLNKVGDRRNLTCGPNSDVDLANKRIVSIDPEVLCPPSSNGESQELILQFVCVFLAISIVCILSKLAYDCRVYRTRGQLPRLALYMH